LTLSKLFHSPTDAQLKCLKNNFKIYIKIGIKIAPKCFGVIIIIIIRELMMMITPKNVEAVLMSILM
jgi:hypothetical protein